MKRVRLIARLDIKDEYVVKGRQLEGVKRVGVPNDLALRYYQEGIDEILYVDNVASLYDRNSLGKVIYDTTRNIYIPVTVGGGIRTLENVRYLLSQGADKVAINTAAIKDKNIISEVAKAFGSQCMVLSIQAKNNGNHTWEALYDNGREHSGLDVIEWAKCGEKLGAGELLLTSVDQDGMMSGMDIELIRSVCNAVNIPVIACGGVRNAEDIILAEQSGASAIAAGSVLHFNKVSVSKLKRDIIAKGGNVRSL